jgi:hypothetical protein
MGVSPKAERRPSRNPNSLVARQHQLFPSGCAEDEVQFFGFSPKTPGVIAQASFGFSQHAKEKHGLF